MAVREVRASWSRLVFFFLCIAIGVASMVALRSVIQSVRSALMRESKTITAADLLITSNRPWTENASFLIDDKLRAHGILEGDTTHSIQSTTMIRPLDEESPLATLVELRAVGENFPFYGKMTLVANPYDHSLLRDRGALVRPEVLTRLGLEVGDQIRIGDGVFTIRDVLLSEAGRSLSMFSMGPRVFIDHADVEATGLLRFGTRVRHEILVRMPQEERLREAVWDLEGALQNEFVRVRSYRQAESRLARRLGRGENYLSLAGFVILILGGVGVWSVVRVFVAEKLKSIAVLKCLGATTRQVLAIYFLQVAFLSLVGSAIGVGIAEIVVLLIPSGVGFELGEVEYGLTMSAVVQGVGVGLLISSLFSLIPLLHVRNVRPLWLLRPEAGLGTTRRKSLRDRFRELDRVEIGSGAALLVAIVALAAWQADSIRIGGYVSGTFAGVSLVLHLAGVGFVKTIAPLGRNSYFPLRHAVLSVSRPGNQTRVVLLAVGLGSCFVLTVRSVQENLLEQFAVELRDDAPDMFFVDIQSDQVDTIGERAKLHGASHVNLVPVLRARVVRVEGARVQLGSYEEVRERGSLGREYTITYRNHVENNERVLDGAFWDEGHSSEPEVSIESSIRERFGIDIGDSMVFDIMGRELTARVSSVRDVEWSDARNGGFMFVFRPGGLEGVPNTYAGFIRGPDDPVERARFQQQVLAGFFNVSVVDLRDVLDSLAQIVEKVSLAISVVGGIAVLSGALILFGSVAMTKYQRRYETAIFRTLGASRRRVGIMMLLEYGTLGAIAGIVGASGAQVLTYLLSSRVLEIPFRVAVIPNASAVAVASLGVALVGVAVTVDVLRHKPLAILRAG
jgi:putative ABC transport system permease protein